jgi:hypothetical protein
MKEKEKKRNSDHLTSDGPSKKRPKSNNEKNDEEEKKEPIRLPAIVQNGLYVAEMFAAHMHTARQCVISCVVNGKSMQYCRPVLDLITPFR